MHLSRGARLGPYEIVARIGSGGMGDVYRASDTRLGRTVALKVLSVHLADDPQLKQRLEREAKIVSSLNHPHICILHDVGRHESIDYLVMEYLEGETLASRLTKGRLPFEHALSMAVQIVDALDAAHGRGVVHRDLKPANIMLTRSGAKLLDFGLARIERSVPADAATITAGLTSPGAILGTFQYMAPEQLEGKDADARTDIFAFGTVLYEMLAGQKAFRGNSQASVISAIMSADPPALRALQPVAPPELERVLNACLAKDPDARWQSARDLKLELTWLQHPATPAAAISHPRMRERVFYAVAVLLLVTAGLFAVDRYRHASRPILAVRSSLLPPPGHFFQRGNFAVSPDGTRIAFVGVAGDGKSTLWVRSLSGAGALEINGTDGAMLPFWAPDSTRVGFFADGKLKTLELGSGAVRILCDARWGRFGAAWNSEGTIVFQPSLSGPLLRIADSGGAPVPTTSIARKGSGQRHAWPSFLPDGKHFLFCMDWSSPADAQTNGIYVGSLNGDSPKMITSQFTGNASFSAGHLLFGQDRSLRAQPFDPNQLELTGNIASIAEQELQEDAGLSHSEFSASRNAILVFQSLADSVTKLTWFDQNGKEVGEVPTVGYKDPRLSPDGRLVAISSDDDRNGKTFIRVYDLARGTSTRLTEGGTDESPVWSVDGKRIAYAGFDGSMRHITILPVDGSGPPQVVLKGAGIMRHLDWSSRGDILFTDFSEGLPTVKVYSFSDRKSVVVANGAEARFSPDGRWIAYAGGFVQPFPGPGGRIQIANNDAAQPVWSRDGKQLFYIAPDRKLMAVSFDPVRGAAGAPRLVFQSRIIAPNFFATQYDVSADGRFLVNSIPATYSSPLTLLTGWTGQVKR